MVSFKTIRLEVERGRARITLSRPEKRNALSFTMQQELEEALWEADSRKDVHCVILRGAGESFSAGYDLGASEMTASSGKEPGEHSYRARNRFDDDVWQLERAQRMRMALFDMHKPCIAQVHGHCLAGGTDLALLCDMTICSDDAIFGFPPARFLGTLPNHMWLYNIGPQWAKRLLLTGDTITGAEAEEIGLVLKAVPIEHLENECEQLADRLALIDPDLLTVNKRVVNLGLELMGARTLQRLAIENDVRGHHSRGAREWLKAAAEKPLNELLKETNRPFGDGRARARGPELRDADGRLLDPDLP